MAISEFLSGNKISLWIFLDSLLILNPQTLRDLKFTLQLTFSHRNSLAIGKIERVCEE